MTLRHLVVVGVLGVSPLAVATLPAQAAPATADAPCAVTSAIGIPAMTVTGHKDAGAVEVRTSCHPSPQLLTLPTPHAGDRFGAAITDAYLADTDESLIVGIPGYDVAGLNDAGAYATFGPPSSSGLSLASVVTEDSPGIPGTAQAGARFGSALSSSSVSGEVDAGGADVVVGEPGLDVGGVVDAGGYVTVDYQGTVMPANSSETTLDTPGIAHVPLRGDLLGSSVDIIGTQVSAGAPGRQVDGHAGAGAVLFDGTLVTQDTACMSGVPETGDHFGASVSDRWIGVPGEDLGTVKDAGMVERYDPASPDHAAQCYSLTQDSPGMSGSAEAGDRFGAALGEFHYVGDDARNGYYPYELAIGVPGEDTGSHPNSGFVNLVGEQIENVELDTFAIRAAGSLLGPGRSGAAFGTAFGQHESDVDVAAPGASTVQDYRDNGPSIRSTPVLKATYRPSVPVPANSYGVALSSHDE
jgi:hypothetical protein